MEEKNIINLQKITLLIMLFVIEFFLTNASYEFFKNYLIFINHGLFTYLKNWKQLRFK